MLRLLKPKLLLTVASIYAGLLPSSAFEVTDYDVVYDAPATNGSAHSMPLGNGSVGLNAWIEQDGTLSLYISHTDQIPRWDYGTSDLINYLVTTQNMSDRKA